MVGRTRLAVGSVIGYSSAAVFNGILAIVKETNSGVESWLKAAFGHHWIGHGILTLLVFVIATLIAIPVYKGTELTSKLSTRLIASIIISTILSVLMIFVFCFLYPRSLRNTMSF
ncbi:MAG: hypothetical protein QXQ57_04300 [Sulfolobales archaeon]